MHITLYYVAVGHGRGDCRWLGPLGEYKRVISIFISGSSVDFWSPAHGFICMLSGNLRTFEFLPVFLISTRFSKITNLIHAPKLGGIYNGLKVYRSVVR